MQSRALAAAATSAAADAEIRKTKFLLQEIEKLDAYFEDTARLFDHIKSMRKRCDALGGRLDRMPTQQVSVRPDARRR